MVGLVIIGSGCEMVAELEDVAPPEDTQSPVVSIINPVDGDIVKGSINVSITIQSDRAVTELKVLADNQAVLGMDLTPINPYAQPADPIQFPSFTLTVGSHTLQVEATVGDVVVQSPAVKITVVE